MVQYTHWKQTVFYTTETLTVSVSFSQGIILWGIADIDQEGESIRGQLSCAPNARNNRDLDIVVDYEVTGDQATSGQMVYKM
jgi:protein arginine N-methyltransferase 1